MTQVSVWGKTKGFVWVDTFGTELDAIDFAIGSEDEGWAEIFGFQFEDGCLIPHHLFPSYEAYQHRRKQIEAERERLAQGAMTRQTRRVLCPFVDADGEYPEAIADDSNPGWVGMLDHRKNKS